MQKNVRPKRKTYVSEQKMGVASRLAGCGFFREVTAALLTKQKLVGLAIACQAVYFMEGLT